MNRVPILFLAIFAAVTLSFWGVVVMPQLEVGNAGVLTTMDTGVTYPLARNGHAAQGAEVYRANGCAECHTQQVRPKGMGTDYERGWGKRRTIAEDYLLEDSVQIGGLRLGPDLSNVGQRQPGVTLHLQHLYNPRVTVPQSTMPRYTYLFNKRPLAKGEKPSPNALPANTEPGYEITPKPEASALAAYLVSLNAQSAVFSAPFPIIKTNATAKAAVVSPVK